MPRALEYERTTMFRNVWNHLPGDAALCSRNLLGSFVSVIRKFMGEKLNAAHSFLTN
jgi:hypothetical protein